MGGHNAAASGYPAVEELLHQCIAADWRIFLQPGHVRLEIVAEADRFRWRYQPAQLRKFLRIARSKSSAPFDEALNAAKLNNADGGLQVRHAEVVANLAFVRRIIASSILLGSILKVTG